MAISYGVIGTGPWGTKVVSAIRALGFDCESCSARPNGCPDGSGYHGYPSDYEAIIRKADIVFIAGHPGVNYETARFAMLLKKPVIVEKPVALASLEVMKLLRLSRTMQTSLIVDYIHLFNDGVLALKRDGITRMLVMLGNTGPVRDYSPLLDYGSHAVAVVLNFIRKPLTRIETITAGSHYLLHFGTVVAEINVSNSFEQRISRFEVSAPGYAAKFEDTHQHNPLAALISTAARLHLTGQYWTNADLAVEVTDLLERMSRMEVAE